MISSKILLAALSGEKTEQVPFWFMRQAGRYLPEYRKLREQAKDFLKFCYTPDLATEVTLQPIRRFGMSGAIVFSDILVVPDALGMKVWFEEGHGPRLTPVRNEQELAALSLSRLSEFLQPVYQALKQTKAALPPETTLIGFAGAPWTLACYVVEGKSGSDFETVKTIAKDNPEFFAKLIALLTEAVILHAKNQIQAGAEVIQLFDSWAGILNEEMYGRWVVTPAVAIAKALKKAHPNVPLIGFPRQSGIRYLRYAKETRMDAISVDNTVPLDWIADQLQPTCVVQGNLDPQFLLGDKTALLAEVKKILDALSRKAFVFNLGHGILPPTPLENMQALCDYVRGYR